MNGTWALPLDLGMRDLFREEAAVFAAISAVLFVTGVVSGLAGVFVMAGVAGLAAGGITVAHTARAMVSPVDA